MSCSPLCSEMPTLFDEKEEGFFLRTGGFFFEENRSEGFFLRKTGLFFEYGRVFTLSPRGQGWHPNQFLTNVSCISALFLEGFFLRQSGFFF